MSQKPTWKAWWAHKANDALSTMIICKVSSLMWDSIPAAAPQENESGLSISFQSFQSLKESISKCFPVGRAERIQQGVDCLMVGGLQMVLHLVKSIAHHLREKGSSEQSSASVLAQRARAGWMKGPCSDTISQRVTCISAVSNLYKWLRTQDHYPQCASPWLFKRLGLLTFALFSSVKILKMT